MGRDAFAQTFELKRYDNGQIETVPYSRWTAFFKTRAGSKNARPREIEPTDIRVGDRLCILLDPSEATAAFILVVEEVRTLGTPERSCSQGRK